MTNIDWQEVLKSLIYTRDFRKDGFALTNPTDKIVTDIVDLVKELVDASYKRGVEDSRKIVLETYPKFNRLSKDDLYYEDGQAKNDVAFGIDKLREEILSNLEMKDTMMDEPICERNCPDFNGMAILHAEQCDCSCHQQLNQTHREETK